jgi:rare lipoprotein A
MIYGATRHWAHGVLLALALSFLLTGCETLRQRTVHVPQKKTHVYTSAPIPPEYGIASWYGGRWVGRLTANGETYRQGDMTAAHKKLPFHTLVRVTDLKTDNSVVVRINNRGPFIKGRIVDLSVDAAKKLGTYDRGIAKVRLEVLREIPILTSPNIRAKPPAPTPKPTPAPTPQKPAKKNYSADSKPSASVGNR